MIKPFSLLSVAFFLCSCQFMDNAPTSVSKREYVYLDAQAQPPLQVPAGVNGNKFHTDYPVTPPAKALTRINLAPQKID